jgi:HAD superfamily hydrolase (TIGR01509 family)
MMLSMTISMPVSDKNEHCSVITKRLIIFDMDGLLLDTERLYHQSWKQTFIDCQTPIDTQETDKLVGMGFEDLKRNLSAILNGEEDFHRLRNYRETLFWGHIETYGLPIKTGVVEVLETLKRSGVKTAIASSTYKERATRLKAAAKLNHEFDYELYGDEVEHSKPAPDLFIQLMNQSGYMPQECLIYEDSYNGIKAANAAGVDVIWIKDLQDLTQHADIVYAKAFDTMLDAMDDLIGRLCEN